MYNFFLSLRLSQRELRGEFGRFRVFLTCLILGVAAITAIGCLSESLLGGLRADGKKLLGGDIDLRLLHRPATKEQKNYLKSQSDSYSETITLRAMVRPKLANNSRALVELKAVDSSYPLVGEVKTNPSSSNLDIYAFKDGAWGASVDANLLTKLRLKLGDLVKLGNITVQLRNTIIVEPDRVASVFTLGPRFLINLDALHKSGLIQPGSQLQYHYKLTIPGSTNLEIWQEDLSIKFPKAGWRLRTPEEAAPGIKRFLERMTLFLSFTGLTILLVGGLGITGAVRSYLDSKTNTIAIFKCLGAPGNLIFSIYMMQVLIVGLIGITIGLVIGSLVPVFFLELVGDQLPVRPAIKFYSAPIITAALFGFLSTLTFAFWPLGMAKNISAAHLFRFSMDKSVHHPNYVYVLATIVGIIFLALWTFYTSSDRFFAIWFIMGSILTLILLRFSAHLIVYTARKWKLGSNATWRLVQTNLYRPGTSTPNVVVSLGLGLTVLVAIGLIEGNLNRQINDRLPERAPAFFFIDIQPDQVALFDKAVTSVNGAGEYKRVPSLRGRIIKIKGIPVEKVKIAPESQWAIRGDRALTYAANKQDVASAITQGKWWDENYIGPPLISLDASLARGFKVGLGDSLTLNVLGREITAKIASLREIDWRSLKFDFAIIFAPGTLEGAPQSHIAAIETTPEAEEEVERAATDNFANISAIRVRDALQAASTILSGIGSAIKGTATLTLIAGLVVLVGIIASEYRRRVYEAVVFKVLGAGYKRIIYIYMLEYGILGLLTGIVAAGIGTLTAWSVIKYLMRSEWVFIPNIVVITVILCVITTVSVGLIGTWRALGQKAAPHLRND